jgi:hypothetical protein
MLAGRQIVSFRGCPASRLSFRDDNSGSSSSPFAALGRHARVETGSHRAFLRFLVQAETETVNSHGPDRGRTEERPARFGAFSVRQPRTDELDDHGPLDMTAAESDPPVVNASTSSAPNAAAVLDPDVSAAEVGGQVSAAAGAPAAAEMPEADVQNVPEPATLALAAAALTLLRVLARRRRTATT